MSQTASPAPADRFALIIEGLCQAVARHCGLGGVAEGSSKPQDCWKGHGGGIAGPLIILIWSRLRRLATRFAHAATTPYCPARPRPGRLRRSPPLPLPRRKAWLLRLAPETASGASQLRHFLADPEIATLLATDPRFGRILRPLCQMLGIRAAGIRAAGVRPARAAPPPEGAPGKASGEAPVTAPPVAHPPWTTPPPWPHPAPAPLPSQQRHALPEPSATTPALA